MSCVDSLLVRDGRRGAEHLGGLLGRELQAELVAAALLALGLEPHALGVHDAQLLVLLRHARQLREQLFDARLQPSDLVARLLRLHTRTRAML